MIEKDQHLPSKDPGALPRDAAPSAESEASQPVVRVERPPIEEEEMGGEAPCQLHNVWDVDAEE